MTDTDETQAAIFDFATWEAKQRDDDRHANELLAENKTALFDILMKAGVETVVVTFDGYGDSGQIENIEAKNGGAAVELPSDLIEVVSSAWDSKQIERHAMPVREAIETIAYALLGRTHEGWENNEGAFGDFNFDVATRTITLEYNERYASSENFTHEF